MNNRLLRSLLFVTTSIYALLLSTERGAKFTKDNTWVTVVAGVGLVLGFLAVEDEEAAEKGSPILQSVARLWWFALWCAS